MNTNVPLETNKWLPVLDEVANEVDGRVTMTYSGRGMFGATCVGIICNNANDCIETAATFGLRKAHIDNMGLNWIVYWPHLKTTKNEKANIE